MESKDNRIDGTFFINKKVTLFIEDKERIIPRVGILKGIDDVNYYLEFIRGPYQGKIIGYKKLSVIRIEPGILSSNRGDHHQR